MSAVPFDTHRFVETLRDAGVPERQAVAHKDALGEASFATKADLRETEQRIKVELIKWMIGLALAQTALVVGLIDLLSKAA
uniref:DUF1640 domain-containing protein n=1 Tax=Candidatus Kentrum eta TaxID=2126337 RepID=A0A450UHH0_9GAMM|nr:MAG: hypothetical protein BECKH772A_GA0070896_1002716 [Candidatus Kentron sp. H]VFJ91970.1 MAG: hypothetical protein BECKH772B_GA0070898_1002315 [Candidatus Kentron sp. H]VFJ98813.1 MAG: hypothetical protein BECKH772C_GA0070978_1002516 [Candidatus Kentron sp. H]